MNKTTQKSVVSLALFAAFAASAAPEFNWDVDAGSGDFNDENNWTPKAAGYEHAYPQDGDLSFFYNMTGTWNVTIPSAMGNDGSSTLVRGLKNGSQLVFDATGTTWTKVRTGDSAWISNKPLAIESGNNCTLFGIEDSNKAQGFTFENGKLVFDVASTGDTLTFESGTFNNYQVAGEDTDQRTVMFADDTTTDHTIVMKPGTVSHLRRVWLKSRSSSGTNTWHVLGGEHHVYGELLLHHGVGQASVGAVRVSGGSLQVPCDVYCGNSALIQVDNTGYFENLSNNYLQLNYNAANSYGEIMVADNGGMRVTSLQANRQQNSQSKITIKDNGVMNVGDYLSIADGSGSSAEVLITDYGSMTNWNVSAMGSGANSTVNFTLSGHGFFKVGRQDDWYVGDNGNLSFKMEDSAKYEHPSIYFFWNLGDTNKPTATITADFNGGTVTCITGARFAVSPTSQIRFGGTDCTFDKLFVNKTVGDTTYRPDVKLTNGTLTVKGDMKVAAFDACGGTLKVKTLSTDEHTDGDVLFDGSRVMPYADGQVLVSGLGSAKVGSDGLLLDPDGKTLYLDQAFADSAASVTGCVAVVGSGTVKVRRASGHGKTALKAGTLGFDGFAANTVVEFGKTVVFDGGTLDLTGTDGLVCDDLDVSAARGTLAFDMPTDGTYEIFTVRNGTTLETLSQIVIANRVAGRSYHWSVEETAAGTVCSITRGDAVTIAVPEGTETFTDPQYWYDSVTVSVGDGAKAIVTGTIAGDETIISKTGSGELEVSSTSNGIAGAKWVVDGGRLRVTSAEALGDSVGVKMINGTFEYDGATPGRIEGPLEMAAVSNKNPVIVKTVGDLTFTSATATHGELVKTGAGTLTFDVGEGTYNLGVSVPSADLPNGNTVITLPESGDSPTDMGALRGVSVLEGTLAITGEGPDKSTVRTLNNAVVGSYFASETAAKLKVADARFEFGSGSHSSVFCQLLPIGNPAPVIDLTNAFLYADACRIGASQVAGATMVMCPEVRMVDSTFYDHYNVTIGGDKVRPIIVAKNSKLYSDAQIQWNISGLTSAEFDGPEAMFGSTNVSTDNNEGAGRIRVNNSGDVRDSQMTFSNGARLVVSRGLWYMNDNAGTVMKETVFDGGIFEILHHNSGKEYSSGMAQTGKQGFNVAAGGLTLRVAEDTVHAITFPIRGVGKVTKDGAGTMKLVESLYVYAGNTMNTNESSEMLLQNTGGLDVKEGTLVLNGGLVSGAPVVSVVAGATLDLADTNLTVAAISGAGSVTNGVFAGPIVRLPPGSAGNDSLQFKDVAFAANQEVQIDYAAIDEPAKCSQTLEVATLDGDCVVGESGLDVSGWRLFAVNVPKNGVRVNRRRVSTARFTRDAVTGVVAVTYVLEQGFAIILR